MSVAATERTASETPVAASRARRWLQFKLGTLLLLPLLLALMQRLAVNDAAPLVLLGLVLGAVFGSLWSLGRMRIVGLGHSGLRRLGPVLLAAISGGATAGLLAGPVALWVALFRHDRDWCFRGPRTSAQLAFQGADAVYELVLSGLYGCTSGAIVGVWGALLVGPLWAYVGFARRWSDAHRHANLTTEQVELEPKPTATLFGRLMRVLVAVLFSAGLLGFPLVTAWNIWQQYRDRTMVNRLVASGLDLTETTDSDPPRFMQELHAFVPQLKQCFSQIRTLIISAQVDEKSLAAICGLPDSKEAFFRELVTEPDDAQLRQLTDAIRRLQHPRPFDYPPRFWSVLLLSGGNFTSAGLKDALDPPLPCYVGFADDTVTKRVLGALWQDSEFARTATVQLVPARRQVVLLITYRGSQIAVVMREPPPPLAPLFFNWPF